MSRQTDVTCDGPGCGYMDSATATDWLVLKKGKKKYDFCSEDCHRGWTEKQPKQSRMPVDGPVPTSIAFTKDMEPVIRDGAEALRSGR